MTGQPVDNIKVHRALRELDETLDKLDTMFLKEQDFLCGDDITLADLLTVCELMQVRVLSHKTHSDIFKIQPPVSGLEGV